MSVTCPYIAWQEDLTNSDTAVIHCCRGPTPATVRNKGTPLGVWGRNQRSERKRKEKDGGRKQDAAKKGSGRAHKRTCERQGEARGHKKQEDAGGRAR